MPESYRLTVERLRATRLPPALILQHVKTGFTEGQFCGTCSALGEIWLHSEAKGQPYCHQARSMTPWDENWPACGRWRAKGAA